MRIDRTKLFVANCRLTVGVLDVLRAHLVAIEACHKFGIRDDLDLRVLPVVIRQARGHIASEEELGVATWNLLPSIAITLVRADI